MTSSWEKCSSRNITHRWSGQNNNIAGTIEANVLTFDSEISIVAKLTVILTHAGEANPKRAQELAIDFINDLKQLSFLSLSFDQSLQQLESLNVPGSNEPISIQQDFAQQLEQILFESLELPQEMIFTAKERADMECYLTANRLLLQCRDANKTGVFIETWAEIESRMLLPIESSDHLLKEDPQAIDD